MSLHDNDDCFIHACANEVARAPRDSSWQINRKKRRYPLGQEASRRAAQGTGPAQQGHRIGAYFRGGDRLYPACLGGIADQLRQFLDVAATAAARPFTDVVALATTIVLRSSLLLGAVVVTAAFLGGIAATFGPVLAFEPLQPKLVRINPAAGLKRLFAVKSLVEFLKTLLKLLIG
jgi:FlhB HrpN YscU SpaS Family